MSGQLPVQIDPIRLADEGVRLCGVLSGGNMKRLQELVQPISQSRPVQADLQFERGAQGERRLRGRIHTQVYMACKRCLKSLPVDIEAQLDILLLQPGEVEPEEREALVVETPLSLVELVEDELLLALPMSPGHAEGQCEAAVPATLKKLSVTEQKANPFAELRGFIDKSQ